MISVIVYGRNDAHWSNLHRRAAISLNTLAHVIDMPGAEILFVDYNTPDDLPTFPEAIADTLTDDARARLRVLRVRPSLHQRVAKQTPLAVVEAIARNVAIRHMRPESRWVLLTNTDVVLAPRQPGHRLTDIVSGLDGSFYVTPRYELPEMLWGSVDRRDPAHIIGRFQLWSHSLRLRTAAFGFPEAIYDYPGDFQLITRDLLLELGGFDERMLLTGACDINLARRAHLLGHECRSLADAVDAFHCSHVRGSVPSNASRQIHNDAADYYLRLGVEDAVVTARSLLADQQVEEIVLDRVPDPAVILERLLADTPAETEPLPYPFPSSHQTLYPTGHVLAFLADLLWQRPRREVVGYVGYNDVLAGKLDHMLGEFGFETSLRRIPKGTEEEVDFLALCDAIIFDCGFDTEQALVLSEAQQWSALQALYPTLTAAIAQEHVRAQEEGAPRPFIFVNLLPSPLLNPVRAAINLVVVPQMTRIAYGQVRTENPPTVPGAAEMAQLLGRTAPLSASEFERTRERARLLESEVAAHGDAAIGNRNLRPPLPAYLSLCIEHETDPERRSRLGALLAGVERTRPSLVLEKRLTVPLGGTAEAPAPSKLASIRDWDFPDWLPYLQRTRPSPDPLNFYLRRDFDWDRAHLLYALHTLGKLHSKARILFVTDGLDPVLYATVEEAGQVDGLLTRGSLPEPHTPAPALLTSAPNRIHWQTAEWYRNQDPSCFRYDAVVVLRNIALSGGPEGIVDALNHYTPYLAHRGVLALAIDVDLTDGDGPPGRYLPGRLWADKLWWGGLSDACGLEPAGAVDPSIHPMTLDCLPKNGDDVENPIFIRPREGSHITRAVVTLRRR